jgi:hypothetical protein
VPHFNKTSRRFHLGRSHVRRACDLFNFTITSVYAGKRRNCLLSLTSTRIHHDVITNCRGKKIPMLRCPRPIFSLGFKSDLKTSTGYNFCRKWVAPSVWWPGKRRIGVRLLATTQCSSSPPSADRLWEPHNTYPNDTDGSFLGYYGRVLTPAIHLHIAPRVNYNQVWNYTSTKNGNARSGLYC